MCCGSELKWEQRKKLLKNKHYIILYYDDDNYYVNKDSYLWHVVSVEEEEWFFCSKPSRLCIQILIHHFVENLSYKVKISVVYLGFVLPLP